MVLAPGSPAVASSTRRCDEWREALRHDFVALDVTPDRRRGGAFAGSVRSATLADLQLSEVSSVPQVCRRTPQLAARDDDRFLQVGLLTRGTAVLEQDGRRTALRPGQLALYETSRPFTWTLDDDWCLQVFTWPRESITLTPAESAAVTARRLDSRAGLGGIVGGVLRGLSGSPGLSTAGAARLAAEAGGLVALVAGELLPHSAEQPVAGTGRSRADLRAVVERWIDEHLADPDLGPSSIAAAHFVSTRQLHRLFAGSGDSVSRRIRRARLERARRDLADPRLTDLRVAQIGRRYGFTDPAGFSRAFRSEFGAAPGAVRPRLR